MTVYQIVMPAFNSTIQKFKFSSKVGKITVGFEFQWFNDKWNCWVTLPTGEIRHVGIYPNILNWKGFTDYQIYVQYNKNDVIAFNDLPSITLWFKVLK